MTNTTYFFLIPGVLSNMRKFFSELSTNLNNEHDLEFISRRPNSIDNLYHDYAAIEKARGRSKPINEKELKKIMHKHLGKFL